MAAAALGHAARRLGGGALRQTQEAAVSLPRFTHTEVHQRCTCGKPEKDGVMNRIQKQKEDLYDAAAEAYKKYGKDTDRACLQNRLLLCDLSKQVKPRSGDPTWEWAAKQKMAQDRLKTTGVLSLLTGGTCLFFAGTYLYTTTIFWVFDRLKGE